MLRNANVSGLREIYGKCDQIPGNTNVARFDHLNDARSI